MSGNRAERRRAVRRVPAAGSTGEQRSRARAMARAGRAAGRAGAAAVDGKAAMRPCMAWGGALRSGWCRLRCRACGCSSVTRRRRYNSFTYNSAAPGRVSGCSLVSQWRPPSQKVRSARSRPWVGLRDHRLTSVDAFPLLLRRRRGDSEGTPARAGDAVAHQLSAQRECANQSGGVASAKDAPCGGRLGDASAVAGDAGASAGAPSAACSTDAAAAASRFCSRPRGRSADADSAAAAPVDASTQPRAQQPRRFTAGCAISAVLIRPVAG